MGLYDAHHLGFSAGRTAELQSTLWDVNSEYAWLSKYFVF